MKILIIDDDPIAGKIVKAILKDEVYNTVLFTNPLEAWNTIKGEDVPTIALIDWMMPEIEGPVLCKKIRAIQNRKLPPYLIMLTSKNTNEDIVSGLSSGADDYIIKPYDKHELIARIKVGERIINLQKKLNTAYEKMKLKATHDFLTGILNRSAILEYFEKSLKLKKRNCNNIGIAMLDIDHFKNINDTYGHQTGDIVLKEFAKILQKSLRDSDYLGRYGGEEFLIIIQDTVSDEQSIIKSFNRIRKSIETTKISTSSGIVSITASIGCSIAEKNVDFSIKKADEALYKAKENGRNRVEFL